MRRQARRTRKAGPQENDSGDQEDKGAKAKKAGDSWAQARFSGLDGHITKGCRLFYRTLLFSGT